MRTKIFGFLFVSLFMSVNSSAQTKQIAEQAFLDELNNILNNTEAERQGYGFPDPKSIDAPFTINENGVLSVTIRRINADSSFVVSRMEAPINKIKYVVYDLYLILEFEGDDVTCFKSAPNSAGIEESKSNYLHIGAPWPEDKRHQIRLQKLLDEMLIFFKQ